MPSSGHEVDEFTEFYRDHSESLVRYLVWHGATTNEAYDIIQEAMIRAYRHWETIESPASWLRTVAARELWRSRRARHERSVVEDYASLNEAVTDTNDVISQVDTKRYILDLLRTLAPRQRAVLALVYDGYSTTEIANLLDTSSATVRSNLREARRNLAERLRSLRDETAKSAADVPT
jgi:RNA polymerase sigma-70 factor (ECF subfamily)